MEGTISLNVKQSVWLTKPHVVSAVTFLTFFVISLFLIFAIQQSRARGQKQDMENISISTSNKITQSISSFVWRAETLSALIQQGNGDIDDFEKVAAILINNSAIRNVIFAPDGVVTKVYPMLGNESVIGLNMLDPSDRGNKEAIAAKESRTLTLAGPFTLRQGGEAITGRLPVEYDGKFWGLVSVTLNYPDVLNEVYLEEILKDGYDCKIWRINPDTDERQIIWESSRNELINPIEKESLFFNAVWTFSIAPKKSIYSDFTFILMITVAFILSILAALIANHYIEINRIKSYMENMAMTDMLTGLPNRRFMQEKLEKIIQKHKVDGIIFALGFLDLNGFKKINDTYGHDAGDTVLKEVANRIQKCIGDNQLVARVGGDEFVVLLYDLKSDDEYAKTFQRIRELLTTPIYEDPNEAGKYSYVSVSIGVVEYPKDGLDAEKLLKDADKRMYEEKIRTRLKEAQEP